MSPGTVTHGPPERTGRCWILGPGRCALARAERGTMAQLGTEPGEGPSATASLSRWGAGAKGTH